MAEMREAFAQSSVAVPNKIAVASSATASTADTKTTVEQKKKRVLSIDDDDDVDDKATGSDSTIDLTVDEKDKSTTTAATTSQTKQPAAKKPRQSINEWLGLTELARRTGLHSCTCVDPGTRNLALMRMEFYPTLRITHVRVLDLNKICANYEAEKQVSLSRSGEYTIDAQLYALVRYIAKEAQAENGCFNSSMVLIEEQSFGRDMARVEAGMAAALNSLLKPFKLTPRNLVPRAQIISSRSWHTCYRPFFPDLPKSSAPDEKKRSFKRAFGMGDVRGDKAAEAQRQFNKRNAIENGRLIIAQHRIADVVPAANMTEEDQIRVLRAKSDDLYDVLFMCLYFGSSYLHFYNKVLLKSRGKLGEGDDDELVGDTPFSVTAAPPQRPHNCYQELFELCAAIGTPRDNVQALVNKLLAGTGETIAVQPAK